MSDKNTVRPPVVAVMGHIDHGKSSLLDYIRKSNIVEGEAGGITQHVSAYEVLHSTDDGEKKITFLDTPGHEAFQAMRSSGATIADIAILVVAADDGVKPQTLEALAAIKDASIPYIVAITKTDKPDANIEKVKTSLLENEIYLEGLGGDVPYTPVSSKTGDGIPELLDLILLAADLQELTGDASAPAEGIVLEATRDKQRGDSATLIIKNGSLSTGSFIVAGSSIAPVRFIEDFMGERVDSATFSSPVRIVGFSELPPVGALFTTVDKKKEAEKLAKEGGVTIEKVSMEQKSETGEILPLIIKADVAGSIPAIVHELEKISHDNIGIKVLDSGLGAINENDIKTAIAAPNGICVGFNTKIDSAAADLADRMEIDAKTFTIIYELAEYVEEVLNARAPKVKKEEILGRAKILRLFNKNGNKQVFGGKVKEGEIKVKHNVRVYRRDVLLGEGKLTNLQSMRADVDSVPTDTEFGAEIESKVELAEGDYIEAYTIVES
ncbi:MAG: translation initiation factor IF-2 [Patescibacteria group bacterium UBA2103]